MTIRFVFSTLILLSAFSGSAPSRKTVKWEASGVLYESCSCSVPCPCNFGQPATRGYCNSLFLYHFDEAHYGSVKLDGLSFAGADTPKGPMGFLDNRAAPDQKAALQLLAEQIILQGGPVPGSRNWKWTTLTFSNQHDTFGMGIGENGGFHANILLGRDGKTPILVQNNLTWPIQSSVKGAADRFHYQDSFGNQLDYKNVNANLGKFHLRGVALRASIKDKQTPAETNRKG